MKLRGIDDEFPCFENSKFGKGKFEGKYRCRVYVKFYTTERDSTNHVSTIEYFAILSKSFPQSFRISSRILRKVRNDDIKLLCLRTVKRKLSVYTQVISTNCFYLRKTHEKTDAGASRR